MCVERIRKGVCVCVCHNEWRGAAALPGISSAFYILTDVCRWICGCVKVWMSRAGSVESDRAAHPAAGLMAGFKKPNSHFCPGSLLRASKPVLMLSRFLFLKVILI